MLRHVHLFVALALLQALGACGSESSNPPYFSEAIQAPDGAWTWITPEGAVCGNGSPTGFGVSLMGDSNELMIFFEGGGACRNYMECFVLKTGKSVLSGYGSADFDENRPYLDDGWFVTSRKLKSNPFAAMNMAFVPYCTGDLHAGRGVTLYKGARTPIHHVGAINAQLYLLRLMATLPQVQRIWLVGFSAGGFATVLNRPAVATVFPDAQIHILDDSGLAFADAPAPPASWNVAPAPVGCDECDTDLSLRQLFIAKTFPDTRVAIASFAMDSVLPLFYKMSLRRFSRDIANYSVKLDQLDAANLKYFIADGTSHVVLRDPAYLSKNVTFVEWVNAFVKDTPAWKSVKPANF